MENPIVSNNLSQSTYVAATYALLWNFFSMLTCMDFFRYAPSRHHNNVVVVTYIFDNKWSANPCFQGIMELAQMLTPHL